MTPPKRVWIDKPIMVIRICKRCRKEFDMPLGKWAFARGKDVYCSRTCLKAER